MRRKEAGTQMSPNPNPNPNPNSTGKMALDQFCHVPLLFLPVFYSVG